MNHSDVYILIPASGNTAIHKSDECYEGFVDTVTAAANYDLEKKIAQSMRRTFIEKLEIVYFTSDEYDNDDSIIWLKGFSFYTYQEASNLGVLYLAIPECEEEDTMIGDVVSSEHLAVRVDGVKYSIDQYLERLGIIADGKMCRAYCNNVSRKTELDIIYQLCGETKQSDHVDYKPNPDIANALTANNRAVFDNYELYVSSNAVCYYHENFKDNFIENFELEANLLFVLEIAILQKAAIMRINERIEDALTENSDISTKQTLELQVEFGKSILLWDNNVFHYYLTQMVSDSVVEGLGTKRLVEEYNRNKKHIEQIAALRNNIVEERESDVLNGLAIVLAVVQILQIAVMFYEYFVRGDWKMPTVGSTLVGVSLLAVLIIYKKRRSKKKKKN